MSTTPTPTSNVAAVAATLATPTAKLSTSVYNYLNAQITVGRKFESLTDQIKADKSEHGYNRDQCRLIVQTAFKAAYAKLASADKLTPEASTAYVEAGMKRSGTDISKCLTLAFPKDDAAEVELAKGEEAGLGINARLELAKGNTTVEAIIAERQNKAAGAKSETARPGNATASTATAKPVVQPPTPETPAQMKLTPEERFETQLRAAVKYALSLGMTLDEVSDRTPDILAAMAAEATAAPTPETASK